MNTLYNLLSILNSRSKKSRCYGKALLLLLLLKGGASYGQSPVPAFGWTSNLLRRIEVVKADKTGTVTFTLAPEDQNKVARSHWPIVFIDYTNNGQQVTQMYNLCKDTDFTVNVGTADGKVTIYGEDGVWKLVAKEQGLKDAKLEKATNLRYVDLSDNLLGTANSEHKYAFATIRRGSATVEGEGNPHLQSLYLNNNRLKVIGLQEDHKNSLEELYLSENLFSNMTLQLYGKLTRIDLSKNLLESFKVKSSMSASTRQIYVGGDYAAFNQTPASGIYKTKNKADNLLDLSVNKLNIATLPPLPTNLDKENYIFTLQERYRLKPSAKGDDVYEPGELIDVNDQFKASKLSGGAQTEYEWYVEDDAATDGYRKLKRIGRDDPDGDYETDGFGRFKFRRGYGPKTHLFVAMTNSAFTVGDASNKRLLESFERLATPDPTTYADGFDGVTHQPGGVTPSLDKRSYKDASGRVKLNNAIGDGEGRAANQRFFRSNTITLDATRRNYWYGYIDNDWARAENWTSRFVPPTKPSEYKANEESSVVFADNRNFGSSAIRNLHVDENRQIYEYVNLSNSIRGIVVPSNKQLRITKGALLGLAKVLSIKPTPHISISPSYEQRTMVKDNAAQPMGTLLFGEVGKSPQASLFAANEAEYVAVDQLSSTVGLTELEVLFQKKSVLNKTQTFTHYPATVDFYSKAFDGNRNKQDVTWQYFGTPLVNAVPNMIFQPTTWVRKYNREKKDDHDEKWEEIDETQNMAVGEAYEISQPAPFTYHFRGNLFTEDFSKPVSNVASADTPYANWNIYANPYTAAMCIRQMQVTGDVEKVVYLYNTGTRKQWKSKNQQAAPSGGDAGHDPGYYTAVPIEVAGRVPGVPKEIPSLNSFALKANGVGTVNFAYKNLVKNDLVSRSAEKTSPLPSLIVEVESENSADRVILAEAQEATSRYDDGYDGEKIFAAGAPQLYAASDRKYEVSSMDEIDNTELGFVAGDEAKDYTLNFTMSEELATRQYYLLDRKTGITQAVQSGDTYRFTASPADAPNRFLLSTKASMLDVAPAGTSIDLRISSERKLTATNHTQEEATVEVFDLKGKRVHSFTVSAGESVTQSIDGAGVYVVKASNSQATVVERYRVF